MGKDRTLIHWRSNSRGNDMITVNLQTRYLICNHTIKLLTNIPLSMDKLWCPTCKAMQVVVGSDIEVRNLG